MKMQSMKFIETIELNILIFIISIINLLLNFDSEKFDID